MWQFEDAQGSHSGDGFSNGFGDGDGYRGGN